MKTLIAGWFSFEDMGATAGDIICRDLVAKWLREAEVPFDVAVAPPFNNRPLPAGCEDVERIANPRHVDWEAVDAGDYTHLVFVCGPLGNGWPVSDLLEKFAGSELIGLNLTMLDTLENWNPFDLLLERDSNRTARPDMVFLAEELRVESRELRAVGSLSTLNSQLSTLSPPHSGVPVVGVVLADRQKEYGERALHNVANAAIDRLLASREAVVVPIDTRLDHNRTGLRTAAEVETLIARMDIVVTTRLHGTVLSLKNGVPAVVIDPIAGGHKVRRQTQVLQWPICLPSDRLDETNLQQAFDYCLTEEARTQAGECARRAVQKLQELQPKLLQQLQRTPQEV